MSSVKEIVDEPLHSLNTLRRERWTETFESLDFKTYSRIPWSLLRKLGSGNPIGREKSLITVNSVATHLVETFKVSRDSSHPTKIKYKLKILKTAVMDTEHAPPLSIKNITLALKDANNRRILFLAPLNYSLDEIFSIKLFFILVIGIIVQKDFFR